MSNDLAKLEKLIGYEFENKELLKQALTHKSYAAEIGGGEFNERLEFLGDSILAAAIADYLYHKHPEQDEGKLSQLKSQIVSRQGLGAWGKELKLGNFFFISKGEDATGGRKRESLLANTIEALIAAIYLDAGFLPAKKFIFDYMSRHKRVIINDAKSKLQEQIQSQYQTLPEYRVLSASGPDHEKVFEIGVFLNNSVLGTGEGHSKKEAEQAAAKKALKALKPQKK